MKPSHIMRDKRWGKKFYLKTRNGDCFYMESDLNLNILMGMTR